MPVAFTLAPGPFPIGVTVTVYPRGTLIGAAGAVGGTPVTTGVISSALTTTFSGLAFATDYWAVGLDAYGVVRKVAFTTGADPGLVAATQADVQSLDALKAAKAANLSDLANVTTARTNLAAAAQSALDAEVVARTDGVAARSRIADLFVNIKDAPFNAVEGQDNTQAIVDAAATGRRVFIPDGNWSITSAPTSAS
jgi:hypothetical protein